MGKSNVFLTLSEKGFKGGGDAGDTFGSTVAGKTGSIEVLDYGFSIEQVGTEEGGRPRSVERIKRSTVTITRWVDNRSPLLFEYCVKGEYIATAELQIFGRDRDTPYLKYIMSFVHIGKYSASGGSDLPKETIELIYGQMRITFESVTRAWSWVVEAPSDLLHPSI
jgi:type VI protein secretion system component Hcp